MVTYFMGLEQIEACLRELLQRLKNSDRTPTLWCPLTESGVEVLKVLVRITDKEAPELVSKVISLGIGAGGDKDKKELGFSGGNAGDVKGRDVLLLDAAVHSGGTMARALELLRHHGAARVCSYSLIVKRGSHFIPTLWGAMLGDQDRAYFLLDRIPNNRLSTHLNEKYPFVHVRVLGENDLDLPVVKAGVDSMDRMTWSDRFYDASASEQNRRTYLLDLDGLIVGYLTIHQGNHDRFVIDEVAVCKDQQGKGLGGTLLRFADTLARHGDCKATRLNAIKEQIDFYAKYGYRKLNREPIRIEGEEYHPMERTILYHLPPGELAG